MLFKQATLGYSTGLEKGVPDVPLPATLPRGLFSFKLPFYCGVFPWDRLWSNTAQPQVPGKVILVQSKKKKLLKGGNAYLSTIEFELHNRHVSVFHSL